MKTNGRRSKLILAGGLLLAALSASGFAATIWTSHDLAEREWRSRMSIRSAMIGAHARQSIGAADLVLRGIADNIGELQIADQKTLQESLATRKVFDMLRDGARGVPQLDVASIIALDGKLVNFTRAYPAPELNLADRDYFQAHLQDPLLELYLSAAVQNRSDGGWTFYLSRKIRGPDGAMVGLVLTGIKSAFFSDFYASISIGLQNRLSLHRADGALLARFPVVEEAFARKYQDTETFRILGSGSSGVGFDAAPDAAEASRPRLVSSRRSPDYPIVVSSAVATDLYLGQWTSNAWHLLLAGAALCLTLMGAAIVLARLVRELEFARNEAMLAVAAKTRFVATVSHEIRTPLNAVIGGVSHLMESNLAPEPRVIAGLVSVSAQHLLMVINDILDLSRLEATTERIETAPFDTRRIFGNLIAITRSLPEAAGLVVRLEIADSVPQWLCGDCNRMTQILLNLLSNAVKYTQSGAVTLRVSYDVAILRLHVEDTGAGLSEADQARVFEPFERGAAAHTEVTGTGLGLAITQRLTHALGGTIRFASDMGLGSTFMVDLPMQQAHQPAALPAHSDAAPAAGTRAMSVLLAEDMTANRMLLAAQLRKLGHTVMEVGDGLEALDAMRQQAFDVVLMDVQMPRMGGLEATRRIRAMAAPAGATNIVAVTAFGEGETHFELRAAGVNDILIKPVQRPELAAALARLNAGQQR